MILIKVFKALDKERVRYLVVGGVAGIFHGNPRFTKDLDILADLDEENLKRLVKAFKKIRYIPRVPVKAEDFISEENRRQWINEKGMVAFTFINPKVPLENVDILITSPIPFKKAYQRKKVFKAQGISIPAVSIKDLILMKQKAGRPQDLNDVEILKTRLKK